MVSATKANMINVNAVLSPGISYSATSVAESLCCVVIHGSQINVNNKRELKIFISQRQSSNTA